MVNLKKSFYARLFVFLISIDFEMANIGKWHRKWKFHWLWKKSKILKIQKKLGWQFLENPVSPSKIKDIEVLFFKDWNKG